jgi:adenylate kinase
MILILGNPGAGKTTQTRLLAEYLGCPWFSMGQIIREQATGKDRQEMLAGKIIGDEVTMQFVEKALTPLDTAKEEVVFEGNPRSINQAKWWLDQAAAGRFKITGIIHMVADPGVAEQRMVKRGRLDDHDDDVIGKRHAEYQRSITPTLNYLKERGVKVHEVDANQGIETVAQNIRNLLGVQK